MFDTVKLKAIGVNLSEGLITKIPKESLKETIYYTKETGELIYRYQINDNVIPYIMYYTNTRTLVVQVSVPKFIYGDNVTLVNEKGLVEFWNKLNLKLQDLLGITVHKEDWIILRVDVCWNFYVGDKVSDYIQVLGKKKLPYKDTYSINQNETVIYRNKSSRIMFYDKKKQCELVGESPEIRDRANGIIRMEISPSEKDIRSVCSGRKAINILTLDFFRNVTTKVLGKISILPIDDFYISHEWLQKQKINRVEVVMGFLTILTAIGESKAKELYSSTYYTRKKWVGEVEFPKNYLSSLTIDYQNIL